MCQWQPHLCEDKTQWDHGHVLYQWNKWISENDCTYPQQFWLRIICKWKVYFHRSATWSVKTAKMMTYVLVFYIYFPMYIRATLCFPRFWLDLTPSDVMWNTSDTGWAKSAWSSVFSPWIQGACVFAHHLPRFEPTSVLQVSQSTGRSIFRNALSSMADRTDE